MACSRGSAVNEGWDVRRGLIETAGIVTISLNRCATGGYLLQEGGRCVRGRELRKGTFPGGG
jgi:hypothetical protein